MPSISRVVTQSKSEAVIESLTSHITAAGLRVDDRLPAERELAAALGVSRPVLREALKGLAALGVVEAKSGSGTYLRRLPSPHDLHLVMRLELEREVLMQLLELRRALESEAVALAARHADEEAIDELEKLVEALEEDFHARGNNPETDRAFHLALYRHSGNPLFWQVLEPVWERIESFWRYPLGKKDFAKRTLPLHRKTFEHIRARDPEGARAAILEMFAIVEEDLREE